MEWFFLASLVKNGPNAVGGAIGLTEFLAEVGIELYPLVVSRAIGLPHLLLVKTPVETGDPFLRQFLHRKLSLST
jgi:hypothetical protein